MMTNKTRISGYALLGLLAFVPAQGAPGRAASTGAGSQQASGTSSVPQPVSSAQAPADQRTVELDGVIHPSEVVEISGGVLTGVLSAIYVERGDFVEEGQLLAVLDTRLEDANLELAQARVDLTAALEASRASREYFRNAMDRAARLYDEEIVSIDVRDKAAEEALLSEARFQVELEAHTLAELDLERTRVALEMRKLLSPVDGVVTERNIAPGEAVGQANLLTIAKIDPLFVEIVAPATLYGSVHVGSTAVVLPGDPIRGRFPATVTIVDSVLDAASNTFGIRLELPNPGNRLPAGLRGRVILTLDETAPPARPGGADTDTRR